MTAVLLVALVLLGQQGQRPPAPPPLTGTAAIRGQITDKETGAPIPRALVSARFVGPSNLVKSALTDQDGRFEVANLPAGRYEITVSPGENRATHAPQTLRDIANAERLSMLFLKDAEIRADVDVALARTLAISGRVVDEFGDPLVGANVQARPEGSRYPGSPVRPASTDDRGVFRIYGVPPGRYIVCLDIQMRSQMRRTPAASGDRFVRTCYPSATIESEAQSVHVTNYDVEGIDIRARRSKTFTISGAVVDATGMPVERVSVDLTRYDGSFAAQSMGTVFNDGRFVFAGLSPGQYSVSASIGDQRGVLPVRIEDDNAEGLLLMLRNPAIVEGRIVLEDTPPSRPNFSNVAVAARPAGTPRPMGAPWSQPVRLSPEGTFRLTNLFGRVDVVVDGLPRGWAVKSIRYRGADITHGDVEFVTDPRHEIEVTLTSRVAIVSGSVADDSGKPVAGARVMLVPSTAVQTPIALSRFPTTMSGGDGRFTLPGVAAGDYLIVALPPQAANEMFNRLETFESHANHAERFTVVENDRLTMNLRVVPLQELR